MKCYYYTSYIGITSIHVYYYVYYVRISKMPPHSLHHCLWHNYASASTMIFLETDGLLNLYSEQNMWSSYLSKGESRSRNTRCHLIERRITSMRSTKHLHSWRASMKFWRLKCQFWLGSKWAIFSYVGPRSKLVPHRRYDPKFLVTSFLLVKLVS